MNTAFRPGLPVGLIRLGLLASLLSASLQAAEPSPQYRLLVTSKTSTLQREIQAAARRVTASSPPGLVATSLSSWKSRPTIQRNTTISL